MDGEQEEDCREEPTRWYRSYQRHANLRSSGDLDRCQNESVWYGTPIRPKVIQNQSSTGNSADLHRRKEVIYKFGNTIWLSPGRGIKHQASKIDDGGDGLSGCPLLVAVYILCRSVAGSHDDLIWIDWGHDPTVLNSWSLLDFWVCRRVMLVFTQATRDPHCSYHLVNLPESVISRASRPQNSDLHSHNFDVW